MHLFHLKTWRINNLCEQEIQKKKKIVNKNFFKRKIKRFNDAILCWWSDYWLCIECCVKSLFFPLFLQTSFIGIDSVPTVSCNHFSANSFSWATSSWLDLKMYKKQTCLVWCCANWVFTKENFFLRRRVKIWW